MNCHIICVGTEILLGDIVNTNAVYLAKELAKLGINVFKQTVVGDNPERLEECVKEALKNNDIIITTGGLGPTADDITKEICCKVMDVELEMSQEQLEKIRAYFQTKGRPMTENNKKQALLPKDAAVLENNNGTAPGFAIEKDGKVIICLPGPPREMKPMFEFGAKPILQKYSDGCLVSHNVRMIGIGESDMAQQAGDLLELKNPSVAPYAKDGECLLRVTAKAQNEEKAEKLCKDVLEKVFKKFSNYIYGIDVEAIEYCVVEKLKKHNLKVAFSESCTGGLCAKRITDVPGASEVFDCGVVSYSNGIKNKILGVNSDDLEKYGAVSETVAKQMAHGVRKMSGADIGVGITGIAGPDSDSTKKPVGLCYIAVEYDGGSVCREIMSARKDRDYNRISASSAAFEEILKIIETIKGEDK